MMTSTVLFEEQVEIPLGIGSLADFRRWAVSDQFPETGRIDFIGGRIEVDMSPEDFFCHGTLKTELIIVLGRKVKQTGTGHLVTDRTRVSCPQADLSVEPDIVFISHQTLRTGRVRLVPKVSAEPGRYVEVEGPPDLIVEIVSDTSVKKDTERLPVAYFQSGVGEFWLIDARRDPLSFQIHHRGPSEFVATTPDPDGFQPSTVFNTHFRLDARRDDRGHWAFDLREKANA
jgi:Uma2 family endonuclease